MYEDCQQWVQDAHAEMLAAWPLRYTLSPNDTECTVTVPDLPRAFVMGIRRTDSGPRVRWARIRFGHLWVVDVTDVDMTITECLTLMRVRIRERAHKLQAGIAKLLHPSPELEGCRDALYRLEDALTHGSEHAKDYIRGACMEIATRAKAAIWKAKDDWQDSPRGEEWLQGITHGGKKPIQDLCMTKVGGDRYYAFKFTHGCWVVCIDFLNSQWGVTRNDAARKLLTSIIETRMKSGAYYERTLELYNARRAFEGP